MIIKRLFDLPNYSWRGAFDELERGSILGGGCLVGGCHVRVVES